MPTIAWLVLYLVACAIVGVMTMNLAWKRGYSTNGYFWMGFLLGLLGFWYVTALPIKRSNRD